MNMNHSDLIHFVYKDIKKYLIISTKYLQRGKSYFSYFFSVKQWEVERKKKWTAILWNKFSANMNYSSCILKWISCLGDMYHHILISSHLQFLFIMSPFFLFLLYCTKNVFGFSIPNGNYRSPAILF